MLMHLPRYAQSPAARFFLTLFTVVLAGCATPLSVTLPPKLELPARGPAADTIAQSASALGTAVDRMPQPPAALVRPEPTPSMPAPPSKTLGPIHINFEHVPLTTVIQVVFADILGRTVQIDPKVMDRRDLVTFRTPADATAAQVETAMQVLLRSYGVTLVDVGGMVRVLPDTAQSGALPEIRRGSAMPETPSMLRPVFQLVELQAVRNAEVASWLKTLFGNRISVAEDTTRNAVLISGTGNELRAALDAVRVLDQPVMRGRSSLRITPVFWSAQELTATLTQVLAAEGYSVAPPNQAAQGGGGVRYPIILLPVAATNSLLVFSISDDILSHVRNWVDKLDQPNKQAAGRNLFTYTARNTSADTLAKTLTQLLDGSSSGSTASVTSSAGAAPVTATARPASTATGASRVVVDSNSNTLIFNTNAENFSQLIGLLSTLDRPSKAALIEVTVAEITLDDKLKLGVEWLLEQSGASAHSTSASTLGGLGLGTAGLTIRHLAGVGDTRLVLNALASSNQATVLSSPRVMARNGESAKIQVGQEVPIITSQQTGVGTSNNNSGVLQTVQYRNTGVILSVKPSIYAGDRIDLDVMQEVSAAQTTLTGVNVSPTFSTRRVETKLTLQHGSTVLLGGLIANDQSSGTTGVPGLKDLPLVGHLFRSESQGKGRTELVILITPYIIDGDEDARSVTDAFRALVPRLGNVTPAEPPAGTGRASDAPKP